MSRTPRTSDQTSLAFPYSCIVRKPDPAVEYYEAYKNIGRKYVKIASGSDQTAVLHAAINAVSEGLIFIKGNINFGSILISKSGIQLVSEVAHLRREIVITYPRINILTIQPSGSDISNIGVKGLEVGELRFVPNGGNSIKGVVFEDCHIEASRSAGYKGIVVNALDTLENSYCDNIKFHRCFIAGTTVLDYGLITFEKSGRGTSTWDFDSCWLVLYTNDNQDVVRWKAQGFGNRIMFRGSMIQQPSGPTGAILFHIEDTSLTDTPIIGFGCTACPLELHNNSTLLKIESSANNIKFVGSFGDCHVTAYTSVTLINNLNNNFAAASHFSVKDCKFVEPTGTVTLGTPNESTNFKTTIRDNIGFVPFPNMLSVAFVKRDTAFSLVDVGTTYVESRPRTRNKIDFSKIRVIAMRIVVGASGDEAGAGKGIEIYDFTGSQQLCEVIWNGTGYQDGLAGSWTSVNIPTVDSSVGIRFKGSSATEDINCTHVELQISYE